MTDDLGFIHRFVPGTDASRPPLLLLHGTGGNENDLLPLGPMIAPGAALLSPRGRILENGMPRFFRRSGEGQWDLEDLRQRTGELSEFLAQGPQGLRTAEAGRGRLSPTAPISPGR